GAGVKTEVIVKELSDMSGIADFAIQSVQKIAMELRPIMLDDLGLMEALEWQAKEFERRTGIICKVFGQADLPITDRESTTAVFRIFQETLTNVARHANACAVEVNIWHNTEEMYMEVHDDGVGITSNEKGDSKSLGLVG